MKKEIRFNIEITSSKLLAWVVIILGFACIELFDNEDKTTVITTVCTTAGVLYGAKVTDNIFGKKKEVEYAPEYEPEHEGNV